MVDFTVRTEVGLELMVDFAKPSDASCNFEPAALESTEPKVEPSKISAEDESTKSDKVQYQYPGPWCIGTLLVELDPSPASVLLGSSYIHMGNTHTYAE